MSHSGQHTGEHTGEGLGNTFKKGVVSIHGLGEAIRGNVNQFVDSATFTDRSDKNRNITERGFDEMHTGEYHGTGAGVTPADTPAEKVNRARQGEGSHFGRVKESSHHV